MPAIKIENLSFEYPVSPGMPWFQRFRRSISGGIVALSGVDLDVGKGESVGVIGDNGSGKTTLLKVVAGMLTPTSGRVKIDGRITPLLELGSGFMRDLSGRENVMLYGALLGMSRRKVAERMPWVIEFSGISEFIDAKLDDYSSGMQARLMFSAAMLSEPEILLLDEILSLGDEEFQRKSFRKVCQLRDRGVTILFVSHSMAQIRNFCKRAVLLERGRKRADGSPADVIALYEEQTLKKAGRKVVASLLHAQEKILDAEGKPPQERREGAVEVASAKMEFVEGIRKAEAMILPIIDRLSSGGDLRSEREIESVLDQIVELRAADPAIRRKALVGLEHIFRERLIQAEVEGRNLDFNSTLRKMFKIHEEKLDLTESGSRSWLVELHELARFQLRRKIGKSCPDAAAGDTAKEIGELATFFRERIDGTDNEQFGGPSMGRLPAGRPAGQRRTNRDGDSLQTALSEAKSQFVSKCYSQLEKLLIEDVFMAVLKNAAETRFEAYEVLKSNRGFLERLSPPVAAQILNGVKQAVSSRMILLEDRLAQAGDGAERTGIESELERLRFMLDRLDEDEGGDEARSRPEGAVLTLALMDRDGNPTSVFEPGADLRLILRLAPLREGSRLRVEILSGGRTIGGIEEAVLDCVAREGGRADALLAMPLLTAGRYEAKASIAVDGDARGWSAGFRVLRRDRETYGVARIEARWRVPP